jgi:hypothetical protein
MLQTTDMREVILIPTTADRNHYLYCALKRIREQDEKIDIAVFLDRGGLRAGTLTVAAQFKAEVYTVKPHDFYGNTFAVMTAYKWAYEQGYDLIHYSESDVMQHADCLAWHREVHETFGDIFASCGWIFNRHAPISPDLMFAPWFYSPNVSFRREKLALIVKHAKPEYFANMREYVLETFPRSILHNRGLQENTAFYEQDGLIQYCLMEDHSQVAWCGIAKVDHVGASGYNRVMNGVEFEGTLDERITKVESLIADPYWRCELFGREVVEREVGHALKAREFTYRITLPGGWSSEITTELTMRQLPRRINSVRLPPEAKIELI